ncbi:cyclic AMP-dependent transcription factor ATF-3-like [Ylistrum balloti]|uniref:cyclic AMP-dependent transcription factor ATF-3-like n=1 Tax=Ylistrum balloti TaxID=509963 RepID=UPI002905F299|nr:cyclic AMP-dependent transcription factor ATF-3-like [Ylistrum balloti]
MFSNTSGSIDKSVHVHCARERLNACNLIAVSTEESDKSVVENWNLLQSFVFSKIYRNCSLLVRVRNSHKSHESCMAGESIHGYGPMDVELAKATQACLDTGSVLPIIKEELKCAIQNRRLAEGKTELAVQFTPPTKQKLRPEEMVKKENRRDQNRRAARKFRQKQAASLKEFQKRIKQLEVENGKLRMQVKQLTQKTRHGKLHVHNAMCGNIAEQDVLGMT